MKLSDFLTEEFPPQGTSYDVIDNKTKQVVASFSHKSNPKIARKRARNKADKLDLEYGAVRYHVEPRYAVRR